MAERTYKRLTWARTRRRGFLTAFATRSSLWLGPDHLLSVDVNGYTEDYKRFYYRDIQAITLTASRRRRIWNYVLIGPTILFLAGLVTVLLLDPTEWGGGSVALGIGFLVCVVPLLINNLRGPTCVCRIHTAVQVEELPSLGRVRRAQRVFGRIRSLIAAAQGELASGDIPGLLQASMASTAAAESGPAPGAIPAGSAGAVPPRIVS